MLMKSKSILFILIIFVTTLLSSCEEEILYSDIPEEDIIGKWELTKIIVSYPIGTKKLNPNEENSSLVMVLNKDKSYQRMQNNRGEITNDSGKWEIELGILSLISDSKTSTFPCILERNTLRTITTVVDPESKFLVPVKMEFQKSKEYFID